MLKPGIKNGTEVTLKLPSNVVGDYNDETNFPRKPLLTDAQVSRILKALVNGSSANIKFSKINCLIWYSKEDLGMTFLILPRTLIKQCLTV